MFLARGHAGGAPSRDAPARCSTPPPSCSPSGASRRVGRRHRRAGRAHVRRGLRPLRRQGRPALRPARGVGRRRRRRIVRRARRRHRRSTSAWRALWRNVADPPDRRRASGSRSSTSCGPYAARHDRARDAPRAPLPSGVGRRRRRHRAVADEGGIARRPAVGPAVDRRCCSGSR